MKNKRASTLIDYAIILGVIASVFLAMNTYIKRGLQGKIKDMADHIISHEQDGDTNPTATVNSQTSSAYTSEADTGMFLGGGTVIAVTESTAMSAQSRAEDSDIPYVREPFTSTSKGSFKNAEERLKARQQEGDG